MLRSIAKSNGHELNCSDDERILCDVMRQIVWQADVDTHDLRLSVEDGVVRLFGTVETCMEKTEAENAAKAVFGVTAVINDLTIAPHRFHDDSEIAREIEGSLRASSSVLEQPIQVSVSDGAVILWGECRWEFQKRCAERAALATIGVNRVVNLITVSPSIISGGSSARDRSSGWHESLQRLTEVHP